MPVWFETVALILGFIASVIAIWDFVVRESDED